MRKNVFLLFLFCLASIAPAHASEIKGAAERRIFTSGDRQLFATDLAQCPVGELAPNLKILRGGYECARFKNRIWIRPMDIGTVVYATLPEPVSGDFSVEFSVWLAEEGCAYVDFRLHEAAYMPRFQGNPNAYVEGAYTGGRLACSAQPSSFGSRDTAGRISFDNRARLKKDRIHRIAIQVRRNQIRFYVDGRQVGMRPFLPDHPIGGISFYFARFYGTTRPYSDAPALVGDIRLATYTSKEVIPQVERDLIRDLGAVETPEGLRVTLSEAILFDFGEWILKPGARATLEKLARLARMHKGMVRVEGHTDNVGGENYNQILSELRAHVVALALSRLGVPAARLYPRGWGKSRPLVPNDTEAHRARNRRVEVYLDGLGSE